MKPLPPPTTVRWLVERGVAPGKATIERRPPLAEGLLEQRLNYLMDVLAEAQGDLADALLAGNLVAARPAARRVASVGWLMREAADRYERGQA